MYGHGGEEAGAVVSLSFIYPVGHGTCTIEEPVKTENNFQGEL